jgi:hypothetical protein
MRVIGFLDLSDHPTQIVVSTKTVPDMGRYRFLKGDVDREGVQDGWWDQPSHPDQYDSVTRVAAVGDACARPPA